jgi:chemotaxis signal transduction protein
MDYILYLINDHYFVSPIRMLIEVYQVSAITDIPGTERWQRGVVEFRSRMIPMIDVRRLLQLKSLSDINAELITLLDAREQDHRNWLLELETSVKERREFKLTTDPHACKFGKWYDTFQTYNRTLFQQLLKFDTPHKRIHTVGIEVRQLTATGKYDEALALIARTRETTLKGLIELFDQTRALLAKDFEKLALVIQIVDKTYAIPIDHVERSVHISDDKIQGKIVILDDGKCAHLFAQEELQNLLRETVKVHEAHAA